jgi:spermidine/putrescine transport system permease protein
VADHVVMAVALVVLLYMFLPIFFVILMSFNNPASKLSYEFDGFTLANWTDPCGSAGMCGAVLTSLQIGFLATIGATVLGTLVAFALVRHRFRGRAATSILIFLPMATPEVVMGSSLEQAAMDLYADEWNAFWRVTFPLVFPGILAAALLSFSLSFDDFIVTNFNHGNTITFPMFVWGAAQRGIPAQVNVVGTVMFVVALGLVVAGGAFQRRRPV